LSLGGDGLGFYSLSARSLFTQGQLAIAPSRLGDTKTAFSIIDSRKQRAVDADFKPGDDWYVAIRAAATQMFFERLREDLEPLRVRVQRPLGEREPGGEGVTCP
jgi:hypothetical protein